MAVGAKAVYVGVVLIAAAGRDVLGTDDLEIAPERGEQLRGIHASTVCGWCWKERRTSGGLTAASFRDIGDKGRFRRVSP
jgi:hypothetical protein